MIITISGKNIEVSDYLEELINKKVNKLDKYFPEDTQAHVTLSVERNRHIVEVRSRRTILMKKRPRW